MDKNLLLQDVLSHLQSDLEQATLAAVTAHEAATHEENVAENKYDTLGLEAAYLASGQARRVEELRQTLERHRGDTEVTVKLHAGSTAKVFEVPLPVRVTADLYGELKGLLGPQCLG